MMVDLNNLSHREQVIVEIVVLRLRRARVEGVEWNRLWPQVKLANGKFLWDDVINLPHIDEQENVDLGRPHLPPSDDDTDERMERARSRRVERHSQDDGTDEVPALDVDTTDIEDMILAVLKDADAPLKLSQISHRADHEKDSYFRSAMTSLVKKKLILKLEEYRYWLASRPLPGA